MLKRFLLYSAKNVFIIFIDPVIAAFCSLLMVLLHLSMFNFFKCSGRDFGTAYDDWHNLVRIIRVHLV